MTTEKRATVQLRRRFDAPPRRVFDAWIDPSKVRAWITAPCLGGEAVRIDLKPRVGWPFTLIVRQGSTEVSHSGEYLEIVPTRRLVFTWVVPTISKETTLVSVDLTPTSGILGGTDLSLKHQRVLPAEAERTDARWNQILDAIALLTRN